MEVNYEKACHYYLLAAEQGSSDAQMVYDNLLEKMNTKIYLDTLMASDYMDGSEGRVHST